jgi:hypothetical protein
MGDVRIVMDDLPEDFCALRSDDESLDYFCRFSFNQYREPIFTNKRQL